MMATKYLRVGLILSLGMFLLTADTNYIESCCPRGGVPPPSTRPRDPPTTPTPSPTPTPSNPSQPAPTPQPGGTIRRGAAPAPVIPRPTLGVGIQPLIQSILALTGVAEPWEVWWTRNRDRYLSFRTSIEWVNIVDQGGTKSFSISPIYDELINVLADGVGNKDHYVAFRAAIALGKAQDSQNLTISSPKAIEILKKAHEAETRYFVRNNVLLGWGLTSDTAVIPVIKGVLQSKDPALRRSYAALALGYVASDPEVSKILQDILTSEKDDREVKSSCCLSLGNLKDASAVPILGKILNVDGGKKEQGMIRAYAALGLGRIGTKEALDELKRFVPANEKESDVRSAVVMALGITGLPEAKDAILAFRQDKTPSVRGMACIALAQIKDAKAYETIAETLQKNKSPEADGLMLLGLGLSGNEKAKHDLRKILADNKKSRPLLRAAASIGLGLLKDTETLPLIVSILKEDKYQNDTSLAPYLILSLAMISETNKGKASAESREGETVEKEGSDKPARLPHSGGEATHKKELTDVETQVIEILQRMWAKADKNLSITAYTNLAVALVRMGKRSEVIEQLLKHIGGNEKTLMAYALHTLGLVGDRDSAKAFVDAAKDNNLEVRKATMVGIGFLMDKNPINPVDRITADSIDVQMVIMEHILPIPVW